MSYTGLIAQPWHVIFSTCQLNCASFIDINTLAAGSPSNRSLSLWAGLDCLVKWGAAVHLVSHTYQEIPSQQWKRMRCGMRIYSIVRRIGDVPVFVSREPSKSKSKMENDYKRDYNNNTVTFWTLIQILSRLLTNDHLKSNLHQPATFTSYYSFICYIQKYISSKSILILSFHQSSKRLLSFTVKQGVRCCIFLAAVCRVWI